MNQDIVLILVIPMMAGHSSLDLSLPSTKWEGQGRCPLMDLVILKFEKLMILRMKRYNVCLCIYLVKEIGSLPLGKIETRVLDVY